MSFNKGRLRSLCRLALLLLLMLLMPDTRHQVSRVLDLQKPCANGHMLIRLQTREKRL